MGQDGRSIKVFVSSTSKDLTDFRAAARDVILSLGWTPCMMEYFGAGPEPTVTACQNELADCQVVLLIVAFRRGWVPTSEQGGDGIDSVTAFELARARSLNIPVLPLLANDTWPGNLWEDDAEARAWVRKFRAELNQVATFFTSEDQIPGFSAKVREALLKQREHMLAQRVLRAEGADVSPDDAAGGLRRGELIPFIGSGIYGDGPLSALALARALAEANGEEEFTLASAAEYREGKERSRGNFLAKLRDLIEERQREVEPPAVYKLLAGLDTARLIVSTALDQLLEQQLDQAGRPFVVVSHILYSSDAEHDGKILVQWEKDKVDICPAGEVNVSNAPCIVYKLLGSPFHYDLDPDADPDTVVITESDHLRFLRRLANPATGIPPNLARAFRKRPLLFLGYHLDLWQYRLVLQVCQAVGKASRPIAVRAPKSIIEREAWRRLQASLIEPDEFAGCAGQELGGAS